MELHAEARASREELGRGNGTGREPSLRRERRRSDFPSGEIRLFHELRWLYVIRLSRAARSFRRGEFSAASSAVPVGLSTRWTRWMGASRGDGGGSSLRQRKCAGGGVARSQRA